MTQEQVNELLKPRAIALGNGTWHYPMSPLTPGQIVMINVEKLVSRYPHLFRKLEWWERREQVDLPSFLKDNSDGEVFEAKCTLQGQCYIKPNNPAEVNFRYTTLKHYSPATAEEYHQYINSLKVK